MITDRDVQVLLAIARYYVLSRPQIQSLCFPSDSTGRVARRRLQALVDEGLINRHRAEVCYPHSSPPGSVYYPAQKGARLLAEMTGDDRFLALATRCPQAHHVGHWLAVSNTHILFDAAIAAQHVVQLQDWTNEWDVRNPDEQEPERRFTLYTLFTENPRLVVAPDAAFLLNVGHQAHVFRKVFYLEQDRGTTGANQVAARKHKGYAELHRRQGHKRHFPETNVDTFTVLCIAHNARRRDALRKAFKSMDGYELWKFAAGNELTADNLLFEPLFFPVTGDPVPLVKQPQQATQS